MVYSVGMERGRFIAVLNVYGMGKCVCGRGLSVKSLGLYPHLVVCDKTNSATVHVVFK